MLADSHIWLKHRLSTFKEATEDEVRQAIMKSDPDTWTQRAFQLACTVITKMINMSMSSGTVQTFLKINSITEK